jgi:hypothetical protein
MKNNLHQRTQEWLLAAVKPASGDLRAIQEHLHSCPECSRLARQVHILEEGLSSGIEAPEFSTSTLRQKSSALRVEWNRRRMKNTGIAFLRYAGLTVLALILFATGWLAYSWLTNPGDQTVPARQPDQEIAAAATTEPDPTPTSQPEPIPSATAPYPMIIDPALCAGPSISPYMPGDDIAFDGGLVTVEGVAFEFWLTCANSTENYAAGTQPIERLGLFASWTYPEPDATWISDYYGFEPQLKQVINRSPVSDGVTTASAASGVISIAQPGVPIPEGLFVLPNLSDSARFVTRLVTSQGTWSAAIRFRLEAGPDGVRPVDVSVEALPFRASGEPEWSIYFKKINLEGSGACDPESVPTINTGSGKFTWPINADSGDQEYPGMLIYSRESKEPVLASDWGTVIFAGESSSDGSLAVVLDHGNGYQTLYGNLELVNVGCGESVAQGQTVGWLDDTAGGNQPYLSFAIFFQSAPFPPLQKLSGRP